MNKSSTKKCESKRRGDLADSSTKSLTPRTPVTRSVRNQSSKQTPSRSSKGLRLLSVSFCRKLRLLGFATYATIADELVEEFLGTGSPTEGNINRTRSDLFAEPDLKFPSCCGKQFTRTEPGLASSTPPSQLMFNASEGEDSGPEERPCAERTLRRRIYDIFNVLLATGTIEKGDNGNVHWCGVPGESIDPRYTEIRQLRQQVEDLKKSIRMKQDLVRDLAEQQTAFMNLIARNSPDSSHGELERAICQNGQFAHHAVGGKMKPVYPVDVENLPYEPNRNNNGLPIPKRRESNCEDPVPRLELKPKGNRQTTDSIDYTAVSTAGLTSPALSSRQIRVQYPFVVLRTGARARIGMETNDDRSALTLGVSEPFSIFSDGDSVTLLKFHERGPYSTRQVLHRAQDEALRSISLRMASA